MERTKYPRTFHVPFSESISNDDKIVTSLSDFVGKEIVVTRKLDGECFTGYGDGYCHARSIDKDAHAKNHLIRNLWAQKAHLLKEGYRVCGENLTHVHSIAYKKLESYLYVYGVFDGMTSLSWDDVVEIATSLDLPHVPALYRGVFDESVLRTLHTPYDENGNESEGWVMRLADDFLVEKFSTSVVKFVRKNHVTTDEHWTRTKLVKNDLS